jgi:hypothetical protein
MRRIDGANNCWVDLYESNYFSGRLRRLSGPQKLRRLHAKSLIVGPSTTVQLSIRRRGKESVVMLDPKRVIPELLKSVQGATIRAAVVCAK